MTGKLVEQQEHEYPWSMHAFRLLLYVQLKEL